MKPDRWQKIDVLFHAALEREPSQRQAFVEEACAGDEALLREVESLLAQESQVDQFIEKPAMEVVAKDLADDQKEALIGKKVGPYEIVSLLGSGGMGEVYRAEDTDLGRQVAIKAVPSRFAADLERLVRFEREAKLLAVLNHPNIATIHSLEKSDDRQFIVLELVEGKTLAERLSKGALPLREALEVCHQIAEGLEAAHEKGIIHRDLKPANIKVTREGKVKILDFGLAKMQEGQTTGADESNAPTVTGEMTGFGAILGTAAYMSPEQAAGKRVDKRTDVWSFGCVLYEALTGEHAFAGESGTEVVARVLEREPDWQKLPRTTPTKIKELLHRCLRKDLHRRMHDIADARIEIEEALAEPPPVAPVAVDTPAEGRRWWLRWSLIVVAVTILGVAIWFLRDRTLEPTPREVPLTTYVGDEGGPSFSPDGNQVAFSWNEENRDNSDIYVKLIGPGPPLRLTTDSAADCGPAWSPDGRWIAFIRTIKNSLRGGIFLIPALGGPERKLAEIWRPPDGTTVAWSRDNKWLFVSGSSSPGEPSALFLLSAENGQKRKLTSPRADSYGDQHPAVSPDARTLAFTRCARMEICDLHLLELSHDLKPQGEPRRLTFENRFSISPVWSPDGHEIIFSSGDWQGNRGLSRIAASHSGKPDRVLGFGEGSLSVALSRQGDRLAYVREVEDRNIWRLEVPGRDRRIAPPSQFISSTRTDTDPQFSPNGERIAFLSERTGTREIWVCDSDGSNPVQLTSVGNPIIPIPGPRWSPDGESLLFSWQGDIFVISAHGGVPQRLTSNPAEEIVGSWSRDGKWIYFSSNPTGKHQVFKMSASGGEAVQITRQGGFGAVESSDGKFLYYGKDFFSTALWKVPVDGGEESQVLESLRGFSDFAISDQGIYFIPRPPGDAWKGASLHFLSFATGDVEPIATFEEPIYLGLNISPDNRWILYTQMDVWGSDLMLVENFR